jgi:hypothetical protein
MIPNKGMLNKTGADNEKLSWEKAREKETEHFIVKTNLSVDALNDICILLECAYFTYQDFFGIVFKQPQEKKPWVLVTKNRDEYQKIYYDMKGINPKPDSLGHSLPASDSANKSKRYQLLSYYGMSRRASLSSTLLHECNHYAMDLVGPQSPIWLDEGLSIYFGTGRLEREAFITGDIDKGRLLLIRNAISKFTYIPFKDFINISLTEYDFNICYPEGWSLIYFLLNNPKYKEGLKAYLESWKKGKIVMGGKGTGNYYPQDKTAHLKLFEESFGVPIDELEKEWKEYIMSLK